MSKFATTNDLFECAIALENVAEKFYRSLEKMFSGEPEVARFWCKIADEERGHAAFLERVRSKLSADVLASPGNPAMLEMAHRQLSTSIDGLLRNIKTLDDAYQLAIELESSETNTVFDFMLANFPVDELAKSQTFLRIQLSKHASAIETEFPFKFKSRLQRMDVHPIMNS